MSAMPAGSPQWEHYIEYIAADARKPQVKDFLTLYFHGERVPKYVAQATIPRLNELGAQGWELVHMQPVFLGSNGEVTSTGSGTNIYFCVFKRPVRSI
ncbi:MAG TPA: hypothetical protein VKV19_13365 [Ktedonobacteraceae bacterium]|jgi:hypothetical protein|nr:hypothetical protein [Ktedonobacteraceae bacterium]